jgi:hypothetical protein
MEYIFDEFKVKIERRTYYTWLEITDLRQDKVVYVNYYLPLCYTQIEAEYNADRIAQQQMKFLREV